MMRYFLAQSALFYDYRGLKESFSPCVRGHWRTEHFLHATVLFLGDQFTEAAIIEAVNACEFTLKDAVLQGLGRFQQNRILYVESDHPTLIETHRALSKAFRVYPGRHFVPHVTLMRYKSIDVACFEAECIHNEGMVLGKLGGPLKLMKSTLTPEGAVYETVHTF